MSEWYESIYNLSELARAIDEEAHRYGDPDSHITPIDDYLYYMEKPWKWNSEWGYFKSHDDSMFAYEEDV